MSQRRVRHPQPPVLPDGYILNILARLPVKSVIRFRCICKSWYPFITSPYFISTHLNNNNNNNHGYLIHMPWMWISHDMDNSNRPVCTVAFERTFDRISEVNIPLDIPTQCVNIVGLCNGLLCLTHYRSDGNVIYLWNCSIRKFKRLPNTCLGQLISVSIGFAYHSENNDYKVVRISHTNPLKTPWCTH